MFDLVDQSTVTNKTISPNSLYLILLRRILKVFMNLVNV